MFKRIDLGIIIPTILLMIIGYIAILSASSYVALKTEGTSFYFANRHMSYIGIGLIVMVLSLAVNFNLYNNKLTFYTSVGLSLIFLLLTLIIGIEKNESLRWVKIGGIEFMPVDLVKVALIFGLSFLLSNFLPKKNKIVAFFIYLIVPLLYMGLVMLQPDFSSALILGFVMGVMVFVGFEPFYYIIIFGLSGLILISPIIFSSYRLKRLKAFFDALTNIDKAQLQIKYGLLAISTGGLIGLGPGRSVFNKLYIPHPHNDMILTTIGEEYGLLGLIVIIFLYFWLLLSLVRLMIHAKTKFAKLLISGVMANLFAQMFVNMGSTLGLIPPTGIPLPFISYGGTNLVVLLFLTGVTLSIYRMEVRP